MPPAVAKPLLLTDPGFLWIAPLGSAEPANTEGTGDTAGQFGDTVPVAWLPLGATTEGTTFAYSSTVEPIRAAEFFDALEYRTTERSGSVAFNLMNWTLTNYQRALNGGIAALTETAGVTLLEPPEPGEEVRSMLLWESTDSTVRLLIRQSLQGGEVSSAFAKAPATAVIPCTFNIEVPETGKPWSMWSTRG